MKPISRLTPPDVQSKSADFMQMEHELSLSGGQIKDLLRNTLNKGASFRMQARGFSMSPFIKDGDVVTVFPLSENGPCLGEIVAFSQLKAERLLIHRVVGKRDALYLLKGDNISNVDGLIAKADILGSVKKVERRGRRVFLGLGPERVLIAFLNRGGLLLPLVHFVLRLVYPIIGRWAL
jgi:hypothetical protein